MNLNQAINELLNSKQLNHLVGLVMRKNNRFDPMEVKRCLVRLIILEECDSTNITKEVKMFEEQRIEGKIKELDIKIMEHLNPPKGLIFNPQLYNDLKKQREELVSQLKVKTSPRLSKT